MNQALPQRLRGLEKYRLEALIDGIFAVALTLLVLDIRLPDNIVVATNADLLDRLLTLERHFVIYVVSFIVIGMYWINHHIQFHFAKPDAARLLRAELGKPGYRCDPIALGTNTDPYQPIEREWKVTRSILEVLAEHEHPFTIVTKSALVERDIDLIAPTAARRMARVYLSITTLDRELARKMEPRAAAPQRRLQALKTLSSAGIPVGVMVAPIIPQLNDRDLEAILGAAAANGATSAGWVLVRLPREVAPLFREWLDAHYPLRAAHIMSLIGQMRGGRDYDSTFGARMRGTGEFAALLEKRFTVASRRLGLDRGREQTGLDTSQFCPPARSRGDGRQGDLFA